MSEPTRPESDLSQGKRGAEVQPPPGKTRITIRIDDDVLAWFRAQVERAGGGSYQTLINRALRAYVGHAGKHAAACAARGGAGAGYGSRRGRR